MCMCDVFMESVCVICFCYVCVCVHVQMYAVCAMYVNVCVHMMCFCCGVSVCWGVCGCVVMCLYHVCVCCVCMCVLCVHIHMYAMFVLCM